MTPYQELLDEAMLSIVRKVLLKAQLDGIEDEQSLYISFLIDHPEVHLSKRVKSKYPNEITIVLQYQFRELRVFEDKFTVNIAFGGIPETIIVPFSAITAFVDPSSNFSLQFKHNDINKDIEDLEMQDLQREFEEIFENELSKVNNLHVDNNTGATSNKKGEVIALQQEIEKKLSKKTSKLKSVEEDSSKIISKNNQKPIGQKLNLDSTDLLNTKDSKAIDDKDINNKRLQKAGEVISIDKFRRKNHEI